MSLVFNMALARDEAQKRVMNQQLQQLNSYFREPTLGAMQQFLQITGNAGRNPGEAYREFDPLTKIELVPAGEHATLSRLMQKSRSVNIGRETFEYRKASDQDVGKTTMSGQTGVLSDKSAFSYGGTIVPFHQKGFGDRFRTVEAARADGYDIMIDHAREADRKILSTIDNYLWEGDSSIELKGNVWLGIKNDPTVATATLGVNLASGSETSQDIVNEVARVADILYITNNCTKPLRLGVSREIMSLWERTPYSTTDSTFGTLLSYIKGLRYFAEVFEDKRLVNNEIVMMWDDLDGFHPVVGMPVASYAIPRQLPLDDFNFMKMAAVGFVSKTDFSNRKCALYASS